MYNIIVFRKCKYDKTGLAFWCLSLIFCNIFNVFAYLPSAVLACNLVGTVATFGFFPIY